MLACRFFLFCILIFVIPSQALAASETEQALHLYNQGLQAHHKNQTKIAEKSYQQAITLNPYFIDAYNNLGSLYLSQNKVQQAVSTFEQALEYWKVDPDIYFNLGLSYLALHDQDKSQSAFERALQLQKSHPAGQFIRASEAIKPRSTTLNQLSVQIQNLIANNQADKAQKLLETALKKHPQSSRLHYAQAQLSPQPETRLQHLETCLKYNPNHVGALYLQSQTLRQLKKTEAAKNSLISLLNIRPRFSEAYDDLAQLERQSGQIQKAAQWLKQLLVLEPQHTDAAYRLGQYLYWLGHSDEALLYLKQQSDAKPHINAHLLSFDILLKLNKIETAKLNLVQAQKIWHSNPQIRLRQATLSLLEQDYPGFRSHIQHAPVNQPETLFLKARYALIQSRTGESISILQTLRKVSNKSEYTHLLLLALLKAERHSEALSLAKKELSPEAFKDYQRALKTVPAQQNKGQFNAHHSSR